MPINPLIFFVVIIVIDLVLKSLRDKKTVERKRQEDLRNATPQVERKKPSSTIRELRRSMEEEFNKGKEKLEDFQTNNTPKEDEISTRREGRQRQARKELIENQREKINKHSDFEKNRRLEKEKVLSKSRLSERQVPLSQQDPKRKVNYDDLDTRKPVTIKVEDTSTKSKESKQYGMINIEEDILKGIIYSEILSKPKSMQK